LFTRQITSPVVSGVAERSGLSVASALMITPRPRINSPAPHRTPAAADRIIIAATAIASLRVNKLWVRQKNRKVLTLISFGRLSRGSIERIEDSTVHATKSSNGRSMGER